jgi:hypothetical protein
MQRGQVEIPEEEIVEGIISEEKPGRFLSFCLPVAPRFFGVER